MTHLPSAAGKAVPQRDLRGRPLLAPFPARAVSTGGDFDEALESDHRSPSVLTRGQWAECLSERGRRSSLPGRMLSARCPRSPLHSGVVKRGGYTWKALFGGRRSCSGNFVDLMVSTLFQKEEKPAEEHPKKV